MRRRFRRRLCGKRHRDAECLPGLIVYRVIQNAVGDGSWAQGDEERSARRQRDNRTICVFRWIYVYLIDEPTDLVADPAGIDLHQVGEDSEHYEIDLQRPK